MLLDGIFPLQKIENSFSEKKLQKTSLRDFARVLPYYEMLSKLIKYEPELGRNSLHFQNTRYYNVVADTEYE